MIEWFARNPVAANLLMVAIIIAGLLSIQNIPLEVFPSHERDSISIRTSFRGATPKSVEDGITTRVEEAVHDLEGIDEVTSVSTEGASSVVAKVAAGYDKRTLLNNIKLRVDALSTLPVAAEKPIVSTSVRNPAVIDIAVTGDISTKTLRIIADKVRADLLLYPNISQVELKGVTEYEIGIEISPQTLDDYKLTLEDIGNAIQQGSIDLSAGNIKTRDGDILVRTDGQAYNQQEFALIPVITNHGGKPVLLGDIATIRDGFEEKPLITAFNGKPAIMIGVRRIGVQSAIGVAESVYDYVAKSKTTLPDGVTLNIWDDDSVIVKGRLSTLLWSGFFGGVLVLIILSLFLRPAVALWVSLGIPVSFMGAFIIMPLFGATFNIMSLFAFILVLGIVVDDAIVTGENIYSKMQKGIEPLTASIIGTKEIAIPVTFGILTTIVAFYPLSDLGSNRLAFIAAQIPIVVIPVLLFSLIESKLVLPSHMSHVRPQNDSNDKTNFLARAQRKISEGFEQSITRYYQPFLEKCLNNKSITLIALLSVSILTITYAQLGHMRFTYFPRVQSETVTFELTMPDTTGFQTTHTHIKNIEHKLEELREKYRDNKTGQSVIQHIYATSGSSFRTTKPSVGRVRAELTPVENRPFNISARDIAREVRRSIGEIPGAKKFSVRAEIGRGGEPINIQLSGSDIHRMGEMVEFVRNKLKEYPHVFDIQDTYYGGKEELNLTLKPQAHSMGLSLSDVAEQVKHAVFGYEAQRIQRGPNELRVMIRYPLEYRSSIDDLSRLPIRITGNSATVPLSDLAEITPFTSPTKLYRVDRNAILNITADVDKEGIDMSAVMRDLRLFMDDLTQTYSDVSYTFKGEAEEQTDSNAGISQGVIVILVAIYALLAIPFRSYGQPFIVMSIIPFAIVGAILGHAVLGKDLSILSMIGMLALIGVVVNDSLVLVDYINRKRREGVELMEAVLSSGTARFRPVILTSITTFVGLVPLLLEGSTQVKFLEQMAISLGFGILFTTVITLIIVPVNYVLGHKLKYGCITLFSTLWGGWLEFWNKDDATNI